MGEAFDAAAVSPSDCSGRLPKLLAHVGDRFAKMTSVLPGLSDTRESEWAYDGRSRNRSGSLGLSDRRSLGRGSVCLAPATSSQPLPHLRSPTEAVESSKPTVDEVPTREMRLTSFPIKPAGSCAWG